MGRPKAVNIKTFPLYDKLHTEKTEMYSGVYFSPTIGFFDKEDKEFYAEESERWDDVVLANNAICIN